MLIITWYCHTLYQVLPFIKSHLKTISPIYMNQTRTAGLKHKETQRHMLQNCLLLVNLTHILLPSCAIIHPSFSHRNLPSKTVFHWTHAFQIRNRNVSQKRGKNQAHMSTLFNPGILHPSLNQYTIWYIQHVLYFTHCIDWLSA